MFHKINPISTEQAQILDSKLKEFDLERFGDELKSYSQNTIQLVDMGFEDYSETGNSRFGGDPDVPEGFEIPKDEDDYYLEFYAQINLAELAKTGADFNNLLPKEGLLSIYHDKEVNEYEVHLFDHDKVSRMEGYKQLDQDNWPLVDVDALKIGFVNNIALNCDLEHSMSGSADLNPSDEEDSRFQEMKEYLRVEVEKYYFDQSNYPQKGSLYSTMSGDFRMLGMVDFGPNDREDNLLTLIKFETGIFIGDNIHTSCLIEAQNLKQSNFDSVSNAMNV